MLDWIVSVAMARPVPSAVAVIVILVVLSFPVLDLKLGFNSSETIPNRHDNRAAYGPQHHEAFTRLAESFPAGAMSPVEIVIDAPFADPDVEFMVAELQAAVTFDQAFAPQAIVQTNLDRDVVLMSVPTIVTLRANLPLKPCAASGTSIYRMCSATLVSKSGSPDVQPSPPTCSISSSVTLPSWWL